MKTQVSLFLDSNSNGLTEFNLDEDEWTAVEDLVAVLKVSECILNMQTILHSLSVDSERCNQLFLCR